MMADMPSRSRRPESPAGSPMSASYCDEELLGPFKPWDGHTWFVEHPLDFDLELCTPSQLLAHDILEKGEGLTEWEAEVAQRAYCSASDRSSLAQYWLDRIQREKCSGPNQ